jgi:hypothetical protein
MRLNWTRWVPRGTIAPWDGPALKALRRKFEGHDVSFLIFDKTAHSQESRLLWVYLRKVAVAAKILEEPGSTPEEREALQRFVDESAGETAELIVRSLQVRAEREAFVKRYGDKAAELQTHVKGGISRGELLEIIRSAKVE